MHPPPRIPGDAPAQPKASAIIARPNSAGNRNSADSILTDSDASGFRLVGVTVAASQLFEVAFVMAVKLALRQSDIESLDDVRPLSQSKSFKQPIKALLTELSKAQAIDPSLTDRIARLIDDRHKVIHRSFLELGWPALPAERRDEFEHLCARVISESQAMAVLFVEMLIEWMKKFPSTSETGSRHEYQFRELADRIRSQSRLVSGLTAPEPRHMRAPATFQSGSDGGAS